MSLAHESANRRHPLRIHNLQGESVLDSQFDNWIKAQGQVISLFDEACIEFKNNQKTRAALIKAPFLNNNDRCFYKAFHSPSFSQRIYRCITSGRAKRTFSYSLQLLAAGINVPRPSSSYNYAERTGKWLITFHPFLLKIPAGSQ